MKKIKNNFPINEFLKSNLKAKVIKFHMPGHYMGKGLSKNLLKYDITEVYGADNYHNPEGIIKSSLKAIAKKEKCIKSFYIVNGSSGAIQSTIKYISKENKKLLVTRDCHKSVINSTIQFGVDIEFVFNKYDNMNNVTLPITIKEIKIAIENDSDIKYVFLTSPNYYGLVANVKGISNYLHEKGILLIVDQAHGSHFIQSNLLPKSAIKNGGDIVIESVHKTLPAINQSALLHINNSNINLSSIQKTISSLMTTSPSYMMMASIENSILSDYSKKYKKLYGKIQYLKNKINFPILNNDDFSRLVINVKKSSMTGFQIKKILRQNKIEIEMADLFNLVLIITPYNTKRHFKKLYKVLNSINIIDEKFSTNILIPSVKKSIDINKAYKMKVETIDFNRAKGHICGTIVVSYPPGIPLLYWGEIIDENSINFIKEIQKNKGEIIGMKNNMIEVIDGNE